MLIQIRELRPIKRYDILGKYGWFNHGSPIEVSDRSDAQDKISHIHEAFPGRSFNYKEVETETASMEQCM